MRQPILFCKSCGAAARYRIPDDGDTKERAICTACQLVHYENPLNVVGTIPVWGEQVLLCKRNIEPRKGKWTLPAGFMELQETTAEGAARETVEEAGAQFELGPLFSLINVARVGQVHLFYRAELTSAAFDPGTETLEARLFAEADIPWGELAFHTVQETLRRFFADRAAGHFGFHALDI
jgi:ADP-ribose pyrophosphatase YjhB (NUDIX family)